MSTRQFSLWRWPMAIAALTIVGLLAALLGQTEEWWAASWCMLSIPILIALSATARSMRWIGERSMRAVARDSRSRAD